MNAMGGAAMCHGARFAHDFRASGAELIAGLVDIVHAQSQMPESVSQIVKMSVPIIRQFHDRVIAFVAVTDKGQGELAGRLFAFAQQFHTQDITIKLDRFIQIIDSDHLMEKLHSILLPRYLSFVRG